MSKTNSVGASNLARFAVDPTQYSENPKSKGAIKYGIKAHNAIGSGPSLVALVAALACLAAAAVYFGLV